MRHIKVLASDDYEGRKPGTAGETKTIRYIAAQLAAIGLEGAAAGGGWFQPVPLVDRRPLANRASWRVNGAPVDIGQDNLVLVGKDAAEHIENAPVWFVGSGTAAQLQGANLQGAIVLMVYDPARGATERVAAVQRAGAAAIIIVYGEDVPWSAMSATLKGGSTGLQTRPVPEVQGAMPFAAASRLIGQEALAQAWSESFRAVRTQVRGTLDVSSEVRAYTSHNVIGRLRGRGNSGEAVLYLGHWDHLGICRPADAADRICNGAVDNASGIAMLIEIARHIARGQRPQRDLLFMGTTAEEAGLLGAAHFGANPPIPANKLVAAINIDMVAIADAGEPVATVGRGTTPLDPLVDATARELGRAIDPDDQANAFVQRQDGWELTKAGVPTVMVGGSFANMTKLQAFLSDAYHKPEDDLKRPIELDGAAEDTNLLIALGRKLADPKQYKPKPN